jgi:Na+-driven multidrug efflux pump
MLLELLLGIGIGVIGTGLAARLSDNSGAAFGLANQVFAAVFVLFRVIGAGVSVAVTQALGAGRRDQGWAAPWWLCWRRGHCSTSSMRHPRWPRWPGHCCKPWHRR